MYFVCLVGEVVVCIRLAAIDKQRFSSSNMKYHFAPDLFCTKKTILTSFSESNVIQNVVLSITAELFTE